MLEDTKLDDAPSEETMFADSMLEASWAQCIRGGWTTLTSFGLQALVIGLLLLLPVLKTVGLPSARTVSTPITMGGRAGNREPIRHGRASSPTPTEVAPESLRMPTRVPITIVASGADRDPVGETDAGPGPLGTSFPIGSPDGLRIPGLLTGNNHIMPVAPPTISRAFRTSSMLEGMLIRRVEPAYPALAKSARIQGPVVLVAIISKAGTIENLHAVSGPPLLVPATIAAVSQWRYRPYILNGEPIEVETQITVNFYLSGN